MLEVIELKTCHGFKILARLDGALIELRELDAEQRRALLEQVSRLRAQRAENVARAVEAQADSTTWKTSRTAQRVQTVSEQRRPIVFRR